MKRIIIFSKNLSIGGMEKALITLINKIDMQRYQVTLVLENLEGDLYDKINNNVKIVNYKLSSKKNVLIRRTINLMKKIKFLIANYHKFDCSIDYATYSTFCSQMARKTSKNSIIFIHSDYYNVYDKDVEKIKEFFNNIQLENFKKVIFVSKHSMDNLIKIIPSINQKSELLGNLIDYEEVKKQSQEYNPDIDKNKTNIVFVGRLEENSKKISKLIEAINNNPDTEKFNLYIIGTGPDEALYKKIAKSTNIIFVGEQKNPYPYIKKCQYLILTSKYEGFPVVYSEATILETRIITTIPVEDEVISFKGDNIIQLNKDFSNFNEIIKKILLKEEIKVQDINFEKINEDKIKKFYSIIENKQIRRINKWKNIFIIVGLETPKCQN